MAGAVALKYSAFISYSHADSNWAKWLHHALEGFIIDNDLVGRETSTRTIPKALRPIFRDRDDFTAGHLLSDQTLAALDASHALIVICSPSSAKSRYVNEEIRLFKSRHPERSLIPLIVGGKPGDAELECFPSSLKFAIDADGQVTDQATELLAADAREEGDGNSLALAKVVAGLLGVSSDDIFRRAERERRSSTRRKRRVQALIGILGLLLTVALVGWINQNYLRELYFWHTEMAPDVLTAAEERALKVGDEFEECNSGCPHMKVIPAGKFYVGWPANSGGEDDEVPQHQVTFSRPFAVGTHEVTMTEFTACFNAGACRSNDFIGSSQTPARNLRWEDTKRYVNWLARVTGKPYRLLSEAEWEYAAGAGMKIVWNFKGDETAFAHYLDDYAWYKSNSGGGTHSVGGKKPNAFGLYDMLGNVWEWVEDNYHFSYQDAPIDGSPWTGSGYRVMRGGSVETPLEHLRPQQRASGDSFERGEFFGFRVARTLSP